MRQTDEQSLKGILRRLTLLVTVAWIVARASSSLSVAQEACPLVRLDDARHAYSLGLFDRAISLLIPCLPTGLPSRELSADAHRLVALSYYERGKRDSALVWTRSLLRLLPNFRADPGADPGYFRQMVEQSLPNSRPWHARSTVRIAMAAAVLGVGTTTFLLLRDRSGRLPAPGPFFPTDKR